MADTPKKVIRLIDNIKLELYEEGKKKYAQIWDPTGNNTYNEGDGGPSGIKSPEKSKKLSSADSDENVIHLAIKNSQIVEHYRVEAKRSSNGKDKDIEPYFTYLQDPFRETPPPKRIYGGGGLGTPEVDNVGPTPYYLNNGCKVNIKWIGMIPNPDFQLGTFSTPTAQERYNLSLNPSGPPRYLYDKPILSDVDNTFGQKISDDDFKKHLRPQSEWFIYPANAAIDDTIGPIDEVIGMTYSVNYKDKPILMDKIVSITLPTGFTENDGKGYLQWIGPGADKGLVYSTAQKTFTSKENNPLLGKFSNSVSGIETDKNILYTIIQAYKKQVKTVASNGSDTDVVAFDYDLKVCFPDTEACSPIPYRSPITLLSMMPIGATASEPIPVDVPILTPKKVKLNVFGLPGVTSLSGETDGSIKVKVNVSLPDFTVYLGDPPGSTGSDASGLNPFGSIEDDVENPDPYEESKFSGPEQEELRLEGIEPIDPVAAKAADEINKTPYVPSGKHKLDLLPPPVGSSGYTTNGGDKIQLCCINGKPVNVLIADAYLDMAAAALADGIKLVVNSGFRSPYDPIKAKSAAGTTVTAQSQQELWDLYQAGKGNNAAKPPGSNHGNGIGLDLNAGGASSGRYLKTNKELEDNYTWLVKNSWKFGFIRAVANEEWHFDYLPELAKKGPYGHPRLSAKDTGAVSTKFYNKKKDGKPWGLDELTIK